MHKVLLIGNSNIYHTLLSIDEDFRKLFKIKVEFEDDAPKTTENIERLSKFVRSFCAQEGLLDLDKEAMAKIVEYANSTGFFKPYIDCFDYTIQCCKEIAIKQSEEEELNVE